MRYLLRPTGYGMIPDYGTAKAVPPSGLHVSEDSTMNAPTSSVPQLLTPQQSDVYTDTRDLLAHAKRDAIRRKYHDWLICDIDAHHVETVSWKEIITYIEDPVVREQAIHFQNDRINAPPYGLNGDLGLRYQSVGGRIPHQDGVREPVTETDVHRDVTLTRRAMEALAIDYMVVFPTPMLMLGMHALGFVWSNMIHATNWIINGIPERFPKLKPIWVESGLAWVPFLMQRLDDQYLMRPSEAPQLRRLPSEYMREHFWYTTQPMETTNLKALEVTLEMINAETQLLFASDWPHYDFDLPSEIIDLPFLSERAKRNILGLNAARIFGLDTRIRKTV